MKGTSKVIMGATLIMVVTLAVVLGLILVLLTELYCSLLLRRRRLLRASTSTSTSAAPTTRSNASPSSPTTLPRQHSPPPPPPPFASIYAQGVLQAPRNFFFHLVSSKEELTEAKKQLVELHHQAIQVQARDFMTSPRHLGLVSASSPQLIQEVRDSVQGSDDISRGNNCVEHLVYISNPIYENDEEGKRSSGSDTPFETPHTSPSRLEPVGSSGEDEAAQASPSYTPPLSPMKKLPAEASSVSLKDATSLGNSGSESLSNNGISSTSSATPVLPFHGDSIQC